MIMWTYYPIAFSAAMCWASLGSRLSGLKISSAISSLDSWSGLFECSRISMKEILKCHTIKKYLKVALCLEARYVGKLGCWTPRGRFRPPPPTLFDPVEGMSPSSRGGNLNCGSNMRLGTCHYLDARDQYRLAKLFCLESVQVHSFRRICWRGFVAASGRGDLELLDWLERTWELYPPDRLHWIYKEVPRAIERASEKGHVRVLEWWKKKASIHDWKGATEKYGDSLTAASANGHVAVLQWWKDSGFDFRCRFHSMDMASAGGHVPVLQWWKDSGYELDYRYCMDKASANGHISVLQWWKESGLPLKYTYVALNSASGNERMEVLQWWLDSRLELKFSPPAMYRASRHVLDLFKQNNIHMICYDRCLVRASAVGDVETLQYWRNSVQRLEYSEKPMDAAIRSGNVAALQWWKDSGLELKYTKRFVDALGSRSKARRWFKENGLLEER
ncbi:hypothetical protein DFJ73DRAFT_760739 [Zopfochytrium polystomum]|nr:hypothetical protein DFJ73DRAFT_760739 [Zopfochytrium polystomum]